MLQYPPRMDRRALGDSIHRSCLLDLYSNEQLNRRAKLFREFLRHGLADPPLAAQNLGGDAARSENFGDIGL